MILPSDEKCYYVLMELELEPNLTEWESEFIESNQGRTRFSDSQKQVIAELLEKYEL